MIEDKDMETFANLKADIVKTSFEVKLHKRPIVKDEEILSCVLLSSPYSNHPSPILNH